MLWSLERVKWSYLEHVVFRVELIQVRLKIAPSIERSGQRCVISFDSALDGLFVVVKVDVALIN